MILTMSIGCDGKLNLILDTIRTSIVYCKKIIIVDSGNWILNPNIEKILTSIDDKILYIRNNTKDLNFQITSYRLIYDHIDDNEWFVYLDSDERLNNNTMRDWSLITDYINSSGKSIGLIVGLYHENGLRNFDDSSLYQINDELLFKKSIIVKKCEDVYLANSSNHCSFLSKSGELFISKLNTDSAYYYTHLKTEFHRLNGVLLCSHNNLENIGIDPENLYYKKIKEINIKYGIYTNNDLVEYIVLNNDFPDEILSYYDSCINSDNSQLSILFPSWSSWIRKMKIGADMPFNNLKENLTHHCNQSIFCGHPCCNYNLIQL